MKLVIGVTAIVIGIITAIAASVFVHAAEAPIVDAYGNELYPVVPRGWLPATIGQLVAIGGVLAVIAGATLGFVYGRPLTWARAGIGAALFTGLMLVLFAVIPNQFVTLAQSSLEWTPQKILLTIPPAFVLGNEVSISYSTFQEMIIGGYPVVLLAIVATVMVQWQNRGRAVEKPKPTPVSSFGRPMREGPASRVNTERDEGIANEPSSDASAEEILESGEAISAFGRPMKEGPG
jgi:hypothetical protein